MNCPRDTQRKKLYRAEQVAAKAAPKAAERLEAVSEIQKWVDAMMASKWMEEKYPAAVYQWLAYPKIVNRHARRRPVEVRDGRGRRIACAEGRVIKLPLWARSRLVIVHELAHVVTTRVYNDTVAGHGREYAAVYLAMVKRFIGADAATALKDSFKQHRVKYRPARPKRPAGPEVLARLAAARQKAAANRQAGGPAAEKVVEARRLIDEALAVREYGVAAAPYVYYAIPEWLEFPPVT